MNWRNWFGWSCHDAYSRGYLDGHYEGLREGLGIYERAEAGCRIRQAHAIYPDPDHVNVISLHSASLHRAYSEAVK